MSSDGKGYFWSAKWVVIIALGVLLAFVLWTTGNAYLAQWQENNREREAEQKKAESDRQSAEDSECFRAWEAIMYDAQYGGKPGNTVGTPPMRRDGTLRNRIESSPEYKRRLQEIGAGAMRNELLVRLSIEEDVMGNHLHGLDNFQWFDDVKNLRKELRAEESRP